MFEMRSDQAQTVYFNAKRAIIEQSSNKPQGLRVAEGEIFKQVSGQDKAPA